MATPPITEVSICSEALLELGDQSILSLTDNTERARLCNRFYFTSRDELLENGHWKFATKRVKLSEDAVAPISEYDKQFVLPGDFLQLQETDIPKRPGAWRIEGTRLLTNEGAVTITYTARIEDTSLFPPLFAEALKWKLAWRMAKPITGQVSMEDRMLQSFERVMQRAKTRDAQENAPQAFEVSDLVDARLDGGTWLTDCRW